MSEYIIDVSKATTGLQTVGNRSWLMGAPIKEQIIRCKDCKHFTANDEFWLEPPLVPFPMIGATSDSCDFWAGTKCKVEPNGFCNWGERKESDSE